MLSAACAVLAAGCGQLITPAPRVSSEATQAAATPIPTVTSWPTSTPAPATLAPTATPTVTATPIVYTVQPGDTLLVIAAQFDVSAQAIQEANGITDPRLLQVGQPLMIPGPEDNPEQPPTPTPTPLPLSVQALSFQRTPAGGLWALGEVRNPGAEAVSEVSVQVSLLDEQGQMLAAESAYLQLDVVPPDGAVAFAVLFTEPPAQFAQYQATVLTGVPFSSNTRYYLDLVATDVRARTIGADTYRVSGQLYNRGTSDAEQLRLLVTGYDDQHRVAAVRQSPLAVSVLRAAAIAPFEVDLANAGSPVVTHSVQAQALIVQ